MKKELLLPVSFIIGITLVLATAPGTAANVSGRTKKLTNAQEINAELKDAHATLMVKQRTQKLKKKNVTSLKTKKPLVVAAVSNSLKSDALIDAPKKSLRPLNSSTSVSAKADTLAEKQAVQYNAAVNFTVGKDSNIEPDKTGIKDTFYEINPTLGFSGKIFSGNFGAAVRDYSEQATSDIAQKSTANADISMKFGLSKTATSTTTIASAYNDEKWPDFIDEDGDGIEDGMPIRYVEIGLTQKISFDMPVVATEIGGSIKHRDHSNLYSDYAPELLEERRFEQDYNEIKGFGRVALKAGKNFEIAARPSITQKKYTDRQGRLTDGSVGGLTINTPNFELITSEIAGDLVFKFGSSEITPTASVGQTSDEALGAENNTYYGFGISSSIILDKDTNLKITPNANYKKITYDNWTRLVEPVGEKRLETEVTAGIAASIDFSKNIGGKVSYDITREKSNMEIDTSENYTQEIIGTTLTVKF